MVASANYQAEANVNVVRNGAGEGRGVKKALLDLVYLRVSQINDCSHCIDMHSRDMLKDGMTVEKLVMVPFWRESGTLFGDAERAALAWAETVMRVGESDAPIAEYEATAKVLGHRQLADLTKAIGLMRIYNRMSDDFRPSSAVIWPQA